MSKLRCEKAISDGSYSPLTAHATEEATIDMQKYTEHVAEAAHLSIGRMSLFSLKLFMSAPGT